MAQSKEARLRKSSRSPGTRIEPNSRDKETSALKTDRIRPSAPVTLWRSLRQTFALLGLFVSLLFYTFRWTKDNALGFSHYKPAALVDWDYRRDAVKQAFVTSWKGYNRDAWGKIQNTLSLPFTHVQDHLIVFRLISQSVLIALQYQVRIYTNHSLIPEATCRPRGWVGSSSTASTP